MSLAGHFIRRGCGEMRRSMAAVRSIRTHTRVFTFDGREGHLNCTLPGKFMSPRPVSLDVLPPGVAVRHSLFDIGRNCWRVEPADRASFLIDGDAYFHAFREAAKQAR